MTKLSLSPSFSIITLARIAILPLPVSYALFKSSLTKSSPPDGKSGAFIYSIRLSKLILGFSIYAHTPSITSVILCGGILVASPTAMPDAPFTNKLGNLPGSVLGSFKVSSKLSIQSTVSCSISLSISNASGCKRTSVYLIAAAESPSILPKLP